jgi:predicted Fe-S protein YdhL (DUF1289 family)
MEQTMKIFAKLLETNDPRDDKEIGQRWSKLTDQERVQVMNYIMSQFNDHGVRKFKSLIKES